MHTLTTNKISETVVGLTIIAHTRIRVDAWCEGPFSAVNSHIKKGLFLRLLVKFFF